MKNYIKPDIAFQKLNLTTSVSTGCAINSNSEPLACPVEIPGQPGLTVYPDGTCSLYFPEYDDQLCYHVPMADNNIFES